MCTCFLSAISCRYSLMVRNTMPIDLHTAPIRSYRLIVRSVRVFQPATTRVSSPASSLSLANNSTSRSVSPPRDPCSPAQLPGRFFHPIYTRLLFPLAFEDGNEQTRSLQVSREPAGTVGGVTRTAKSGPSGAAGRTTSSECNRNEEVAHLYVHVFNSLSIL